jgi:hypothetical protein
MPTSALDALLNVARLVHHEYRIRAAQALHDIITRVIADRIGVPPGCGQEVMHPVLAINAQADRPLGFDQVVESVRCLGERGFALLKGRWRTRSTSPPAPARSPVPRSS